MQEEVSAYVLVCLIQTHQLCFLRVQSCCRCWFFFGVSLWSYFYQQWLNHTKHICKPCIIYFFYLGIITILNDTKLIIESLRLKVFLAFTMNLLIIPITSSAKYSLSDDKFTVLKRIKVRTTTSLTNSSLIILEVTRWYLKCLSKKCA